MASTAPADVIRRLLDDDTIHEHMAEAGAGVRDAYRRARRLPPAKAVQDKTVYDRLRQGGGGATAATRGALGKPEPKPKRGGRRVLALLVLGATGAVGFLATKRDQQRAAPTAPTAAPPPPPPPPPPPRPPPRPRPPRRASCRRRPERPRTPGRRQSPRARRRSGHATSVQARLEASRPRYPEGTRREVVLTGDVVNTAA